MKRLFVAIKPPEDIIDDLVEMQPVIKGARSVLPDNIHLTLAFLGNVDDSLLPKIVEALKSISLGSFDLALKASGYFGSKRFPRTLWVGVDSSEGLDLLQKMVVKELDREEIEFEHRKFSPHLTISRLKNVSYEEIASYIVSQSLFTSMPFEIESFSLFESVLSSEGSRYYELERFELHC